jgi:hypothetical protein
VFTGHHRGEVPARDVGLSRPEHPTFDLGWSEKIEKTASAPPASFMHSHPLLHFVSAAPILGQRGHTCVAGGGDQGIGGSRCYGSRPCSSSTCYRHFCSEGYCDVR